MKEKRKTVYEYPTLPGISSVSGMAGMPLVWEYLLEYARTKYEQGGEREQIQIYLDEVLETIQKSIEKIRALPEDPLLVQQEPDQLEEILRCRPEKRVECSPVTDESFYFRKIKGAVYGRFAGCTLGAPVEFWSVEEMKEWAAYCGQAFPPDEYWRKTKKPGDFRYEVSRFEEYELEKIDKVPVDDDVTYTVLGWLILEKYGLEFTTEDISNIWKKYLPRACTAEEVVLNNLRNNISAEKAADVDNPYVQWIGADIRADTWGYVSPGAPQKAACLAYRDARLTHRRNGIYGEMYFSAVIAAAFSVGGEGDDLTMEEVIQAGLCEIPQNCLLAKDIRWALDSASEIMDYKAARKAAEEHFGGMSGVHTNFNACLTIWGLLIGKDDFTKVIGEITAMGYDNDCNAATAGSIFGAYYGIHKIPEKWYRCFHNKVYTYLNGYRYLKIDRLCERFWYFAKINSQ